MAVGISAPACLAVSVLLLALPCRAGTQSLDGRADFERGLAADLGSRGRPDPVAAYGYYQRSAAAGDADAELNLGVMNDSGVGTLADAAQAALWYARAASHGNGRAAFDVAQLYEAGDGVPQNRPLAAAWFAQAAAEGIPAAAERAGRLHAPAAGGTVAAPSPLAPAASAVLHGEDVEFVWQPASALPDMRYWVEVKAVGTTDRPVAYRGTRTSSLLVEVPSAGTYAWRVFAASAALGHYSASPWSAFSVRRGDECCLAALTTR